MAIILILVQVFNQGKPKNLEYGVSEWTGDASDINYDWSNPIKFDDARHLAQYILLEL